MYQSEDATLILLVEDDLYLRQSTEELLKFENYRCVSVRNPREALAFLSSTTILPRLIISDIIMREMGGFQFLVAVRDNPIWQQIPFLFVTCQEAPGLVQDSEFGTVGYIPKPFNIRRFLDTIRHLINRIHGG